MAVLSKADINKRNNRQVLYDRINNGAFKMGKDDSPLFKCTGRVKINGVLKKKIELQEIESLFHSNKAVKFDIELSNKGWVSYTKLFKDKEFGGTAAKSGAGGSERQELRLIEAINENLLKDPTIKIHKIKEQIVKASKNEGLSKLGQEPYIDVNLHTKSGIVGVSCKGTSAPSLAGGGLIGMEVVAPKFVDTIYDKIINELKSQKYEDGMIVNVDDLPDYYIEIPKKYVRLLVEGNDEMGGPIKYMYVGPMNVSSSVTGKTLKMNGEFFTIDDYLAKVKTLYVRVRKRDVQPDKLIQIDFKTKTKSGRPRIFSAPKTKKNNLRLVIIDSSSISSKGKKL